MNFFEIIAVIVLGYLIGSIPSAVIIAKQYGVDIMAVGSQSSGATNVTRVLGKRAGNLCFILDFLKGLLASGWPLLGASDPLGLGFLGLLAAILGHSYSLFMGFRGGKGVAVTMGGLLALSPLILIIGLLVWGAVFYATKYVSLASICFGASLPVLGIGFERPPLLILLFFVVAALIMIAHRSNIKRLLAGTESRFSKKE